MKQLYSRSENGKVVEVFAYFSRAEVKAALKSLAPEGMEVDYVNSTTDRQFYIEFRAVRAPETVGGSHS